MMYDVLLATGDVSEHRAKGTELMVRGISNRRPQTARRNATS
jgi:hypothetical protein